MITLEDLDDMSALTRSEIAALTEHEHLNTFDATLLGHCLMRIPHWPQTAHEMICDDIRRALHEDNLSHARDLFAVPRQFVADHPETTRGGFQSWPNNKGARK